MPNEMPGVVPMPTYEDGIAALEWLSRVFGFREREQTRVMESDGRLGHAQMDAGDGVIMLAALGPDYESPKRHRQHCERTRAWSDVPWVINGVLVYLDDVDQHYDRAKRAGAHILSDPEDGYPGRRYRVEDLEGHRWFFLQR
jgi:uncharacterized glyoxalase superfamily protein PhnB